MAWGAPCAMHHHLLSHSRTLVAVRFSRSSVRATRNRCGVRFFCEHCPWQGYGRRLASANKVKRETTISKACRRAGTGWQSRRAWTERRLFDAGDMRGISSSNALLPEAITCLKSGLITSPTPESSRGRRRVGAPLVLRLRRNASPILLLRLTR